MVDWWLSVLLGCGRRRKRKKEEEEEEEQEEEREGSRLVVDYCMGFWFEKRRKVAGGWSHPTWAPRGSGEVSESISWVHCGSDSGTHS